MNTAKEKLRRQLKLQRLGLSQEEVAAKSQIIANKLLATIDWSTINTLHSYTSMQTWNEVDTRKIITRLEKTYPHISITARPARKNEPLPDGQFDLIIVPVLGFDKHNYRLGLGGGWYDRFLATQPRASTIGLAYSFAQIKGLPHEKHDIALDTIITDL